MKISKLLAALISASAALAPLSSQAEDLWGCEVLLCMANPAGPMAAAACVPPITKLYKAIFKPWPDPFPKCLQANPNGGNANRVDMTIEYFDACPAGSTALPRGSFSTTTAQLAALNTAAATDPNYATQAQMSAVFGLAASSYMQTTLLSKLQFAKGIGEGSAQDFWSNGDGVEAVKTCVVGAPTQKLSITVPYTGTYRDEDGNLINSNVRYTSGQRGNNTATYSVDVYDSAFTIQRNTKPHTFNVMIEDKLFNKAKM